MINLKEAQSKEDYAIAINLFQAYAAQLEVDLSFQNFAQEIKDIESQYAQPNGAIYIAYDKDIAIGCFGVRAFEPSICELKRMYLKDTYRGQGIGRLLLEKSIGVGAALNYKKMRLDTLPSMQSAIKLYQKLGFYEIEPYRFNPIKGTKYFELKL